MSNPGKLSITSNALSTCSWSSAKRILDSECDNRYSTSEGGLVGYRPTLTAPIDCMPISARNHSGLFSECIATELPFSIPKNRNAIET